MNKKHFEFCLNCDAGFLDGVQLLLDHGADINARNSNGMTILGDAITHGNHLHFCLNLIFFNIESFIIQGWNAHIVNFLKQKGAIDNSNEFKSSNPFKYNENSKLCLVLN